MRRMSLTQGADTRAPELLLRMLRSQSIAYAAVGCVNTALGFVLFVGWITVLGEQLTRWPSPRRTR